ncbi:MAG TPA: site-specific DNA-methyltransferase [Candidatus Cloacimonadota bacterium]|nr:site-specific DNA-methyltransferase [Candidatus Cloacimonadota bacterium]HQL15565.1 site-specific DNA-methyltransferase [Candidatus Cloacimonadota bacterium]
MPSTEQLRTKLTDKLKELFQLNQPDLDFGFYRIMHAKSEQVINFIEHDLLQVIKDTFGQVDEQHKQQLKDEIEKEIRQAKEYGVSDPENSPKVIEAKAKYEAVRDGATSEAEIYDHLYRFFERYYDDGDFISRRYYTRETPGKAAPFAIPYNGEEVKLYWANADQYYIKTTEYFTNFTVNLTEAIRKLRESQKSKSEQLDLADSSVPEGLKLHFKIVDATEGEHANIKAGAATKRYFILHKDNPVELNENKELIINFEYRPNQAEAKQDALNKDAISCIINALKLKPEMAVYYECLSIAIPTDKEKDRILLSKYINQYTARNTMDYFIHKNLGAFLKRELDFYIKNEVMRLDDIENADAPKVEDYLTKLRVLRQIATKLIDFMAQLEDFQKKLWLKKKFIVETNYCITLDRVPEELYPQVIANDAQRQEWVKLFAIDEIEGDAVSPAYSEPLTVKFLKVNDKLVLDTRFFDESFKAKLLSSIDDFDEQCDGLLIHSENFQALNLLQDRYREQIKCIYIDPPYNTKSSEIMYKNSYKDSSWLSLMFDRLVLGKTLLLYAASIVIAIDEVEQERLGQIVDQIFPDWKKVCVSIVHNPRGQQGKNVSYVHEFAYFIYPNDESKYIAETKREEIDSRTLRDSGGESDRTDAKTCFYPIIVKNNKIVRIGEVPNDDFHPKGANVEINNGEIEIWPISEEGVEKKWRYSVNTVHKIFDKLEVKMGRSLFQIIYNKDTGTMKSLWTGAKYDASEYGTKVLQDILGYIDAQSFSYPKSIHTITETLTLQLNGDNEGLILDYFAGSGTTGHAVINLNREDSGKRKYILVEMGDYFDTVLKPRISKVVYSKDWKDGKPQSRDTGVSHCYKYLRLESYEDTLNNLVLTSEPEREKALAVSPTLQEDYMLHYMLDIESRGSLLNIDSFSDPTAYLLKVKKPGSDEYVEKAVDLIETFNYLIGLRLVHLAEPQTFTASFTRLKDPDLPQDQDTKLVLDGDLKQAADGKWWIRKVEGWVPRNPYNPNDGLKDKVLIVWRKLTGNLEEDNLVLDTWFQKNRISTLDWEFNTIYVNGSNNLPNLLLEGDTWKVRLIEEEFLKRLWSTEGV